MRRALVAVTLAALLPSWAAADQALYRRHCGPCHLPGGTGTLMLGRRLGPDKALLESRTDLAPEYVRAVARNGIQSMPRFARPELPDAELELIARYLARAAGR